MCFLLPVLDLSIQSKYKNENILLQQFYSCRLKNMTCLQSTEFSFGSISPERCLAKRERETTQIGNFSDTEVRKLGFSSCLNINHFCDLVSHLILLNLILVNCKLKGRKQMISNIFVILKYVPLDTVPLQLPFLVTLLYTEKL